MKKVLIFTLTATLLLLATMNTLGAIHPSRELRILDWDFNSFVVYFANGAGIHEGWFTTEAPETYMLGAIDYSEETQNYGFYYYQNPQTFAEISDFIYGDGDYSTINVKGSYLFSFGLFAAVSYYNGNSFDDTLLSLGYRYSFDDDSYVALSYDYDTEYEEYQIDLDLEYYFDNAVLFVQFVQPEDGDLVYSAGVNFQVSETFTLGLRYDGTQYSDGYQVGFTWDNGKFVLNGSTGDNYEFDEYYAVGLFYRFSDAFSAGFDYSVFDERDDPFIIYKLNYKTDSFIFAFHYVVNGFGTP